MKNASIPFMNTLLHITQSTRYATTPAISPARIQFMKRLLWIEVCYDYFLSPGTPNSVIARRSST